MNKERLEDVLLGLGPAVKKEMLDALVKFLLSDLQETEKKELLQKVVAGGRENRQVIDMVDH